ncbi:MAG: ferrochelatase [Alphaproteobacteria bacterium]|nr:ferrochelatase [Alphaproteobacteria bacterium]
MTDTLPNGHLTLQKPQIGVLLVNLGTPDGYDVKSMRRYLAEFLSDPRVIEAPRWIWWPILHGIILNTRPRKSGEAYRKIWMEDQGESPLRYYTRALTEALAPRFSDQHVLVDWAMRYGTPSIPEKLEDLRAQGCQKILICALYPQYSAATTASVYDKAFDQLKTMRWQPAVRTVPSFHDEPRYIEALAESVRVGLKDKPEPEMLLCSFHGLPKENLDKGDPYHCFCQKTGRLLREALNWPEDRFGVVFQSRFGPKEWLQPYADQTVAALGDRGVKSLAILSPGFVADCVETLEELAIGLKETFEEHGGQTFDYIPCLNDSNGLIDTLEVVTRRELSGWI